MSPKPNWWGNFADAPLALEQTNHERGDPCALGKVAGVQDCSYGKSDGLGGKVIPQRGDRLTLRRPYDSVDPDAIEVWWKNRHMLGHVRWGTALVLAPEMDAGKSLRAYVADPGDGSAWSMYILLIGQAMCAICTDYVL